MKRVFYRLTRRFSSRVYGPILTKPSYWELERAVVFALWEFKNLNTPDIHTPKPEDRIAHFQRLVDRMRDGEWEDHKWRNR